MKFEQPATAEDPRVVIEAIRAQIAAMGANDSEFRQIDDILARLSRDEYQNPEEAVKDAYRVLNSKQDYH